MQLFSKNQVCAHTSLFFRKKREAGASLFLVGFSRKTVKTVVPARGLPANPASGKATHPGTVTDRYTRGGLTPGLAPALRRAFRTEHLCAATGKSLLAGKTFPSGETAPIGRAAPIRETAPSAAPTGRAAPIRETAPSDGPAYADAPFAACPSLRAEATACAAPSAHCSAACRS